MNVSWPLAYQDFPAGFKPENWLSGLVIASLWAVLEVGKFLRAGKDKNRVDTMTELNAMLKTSIDDTTKAENLNVQYLKDNADLRERLSVKSVNVGELTIEKTYLLKKIEERDARIMTLEKELEKSRTPTRE